MFDCFLFSYPTIGVHDSDGVPIGEVFVEAFDRLYVLFFDRRRTRSADEIGGFWFQFLKAEYVA